MAAGGSKIDRQTSWSNSSRGQVPVKVVDHDLDLELGCGLLIFSVELSSAGALDSRALGQLVPYIKKLSRPAGDESRVI
jgi:hypothetical protein